MKIYIGGLYHFDASYLAAAERWLSIRELKQIKRYQHLESRKRALISFGMRRQILSGYLHCHPREIQFFAGPYGKPQLADKDLLHFNISHSGEYIVIGISESSIGIDLEQHNTTLDILGVGSLVFAEAEMQLLKGCSIEEERWALFYDLWTKKEAYLKAIGWGFYFETPSQFDFSSKGCTRIGINDTLYQVSNIHHLPGYSLAICQKEHTMCQIEKFVPEI